jgi:hypothetical protein
MSAERYYVQRRAASGSVLRWDRGSVLWVIDHRSPTLVTREVADELAATYGGVVAEVIP